MAGVLATSRRTPAALIGILVALIAAATVVSATASLAGTALTSRAEVHRLAYAPVVVVGEQHVYFDKGHTKDDDVTSYPLTTARGVPAALAARLAATPGVARVVPDVSVPVVLLGAGGGQDVVAHGWASASLTPLRLTAGHAPTVGEVVLTRDAAAALHAAVGTTLRLGGRDVAPLRVSGLADGDTGGPSAYLDDATADGLTGTPGRVDLLAVFPRSGTSVASLADRIDDAAGSGYDVLTGASRGQAEDHQSLEQQATVTEFAFAAGVPVVLVSLFVAAGAVGLALAERKRHIALLRAVGATPGQIRRTIARELALLGIVAGLIGYPIGTFLGRVGVSGMVRHHLLPAGTSAWTAWWVVPIACGAGLVVSQLSGFVAGWRASRARLALAIGESISERRHPHPVRLLLGLVFAAGGVALALLTYHETHNVIDALTFGQLTLMAFVVAIAFLAPTIVSLAELLLRVPARLFGRTSGWLASADTARRPRRVAPAVVAVAASIGFLGTVALVSAEVVHADASQTEARLAADQVITAPGGLSPAVLPELTGRPGVHAAVGVIDTTAYPDLGGGDEVSAAALTAGPIPDVLRLEVIDGNLDSLRPGQIAVSRLEAGDRKVGSTLTTFLADGTEYRATITAIYQRGLGFGDVVLPAAAATGHLGSSTIDQVLVSGTVSPGDVASLARQYPGLSVQSRAAANAQAAENDRQDQYLNDLVIQLITMLATVTLINTMVTATLERRTALRLLERVGTTRGQLLGMAWWQTGLIVATGLLTGAAAGGASLIAVGRALTGNATPYLPPGPILAAVAAITAVTALAIVGPTAALLRRR